jgi:Peptidase family M28
MPSSSVDDVAARLRHDVEHLATLDRRTTSPGERSSGEWIAGRLRGIGAADVTTSPFRSQSSWAPANLAHLVLAMAAGAVPGVIGRLLAAAVAASYELDVSGRSHWLRRLLPAKTGVSVTGRMPLPGDAKPDKTLVLVAHHDAAHNGIVWHRRTVALNRVLSQRTGETMPTHAPALVAMAANMLPIRPVRMGAQFILGGVVLAAIQSMRSYTTPGANDNATGVATVLEVADRLRAQHGMEVLLVFPGGEEAGNTGIVRHHHRAAPRPARHIFALLPERMDP